MYFTHRMSDIVVAFDSICGEWEKEEMNIVCVSWAADENSILVFIKFLIEHRRDSIQLQQFPNVTKVKIVALC